ncbi:hypothetical protein BDC45DRAFT_540752 [Circinella umbellata]|nr:hypothetical protein BDC45DRAFT_540752 [Circinella umbellata]
MKMNTDTESFALFGGAVHGFRTMKTRSGVTGWFVPLGGGGGGWHLGGWLGGEKAGLLGNTPSSIWNRCNADDNKRLSFRYKDHRVFLKFPCFCGLPSLHSWSSAMGVSHGSIRLRCHPRVCAGCAEASGFLACGVREASQRVSHVGAITYFSVAGISTSGHSLGYLQNFYYNKNASNPITIYLDQHKLNERDIGINYVFSLGIESKPS